MAVHDVVAAMPRVASVFAIHQRAIHKLALAIAKAQPHVQIRNAVANTLNPISVGPRTPRAASGGSGDDGGPSQGSIGPIELPW